MVDVMKLRGAIAEAGKNGIYMAKVINCAPKTFYLKMKDGKFDTDEAQLISDDLGLTDEQAIAIFMPKE